MKKTKHFYRVLKQTRTSMSPQEIVNLRKETLNISQGLFADILGVSVRAVTSWECGWRTPSVARIELLRLYQEKPEEIASLIGEKNEK